MKVRFEWTARDDATLDAVLADERLSFRAKGLFAHLVAAGSGVGLDLKQLLAAASEGKDALRTALAELEAAGACTRTEVVEQQLIAPEQEGDAAPVPVMDSLFGETFAPPIPIDEMPDAVREETSEEASTSEDAAIERIVRRLNELRKRHWEWAHYTPLQAKYPKNVEQIKRRLREGHAEQDLLLVLEYRAAVDGGDERSRRYFNSDTPFNTRNFEENLAMALDWAARGRSPQAAKKPGTSRGAEYYLEEQGRST